MANESSTADKSGSGSHSAIDHLLAHTLEHFRAIVQSSDDAIISKSLDGLVTSWNSGAQSIFGYTEEEMLGKPILGIFPPERVAEEAFILQQVAHGAKVDHFETERLHKNGNRINVSVTISPIRDRNGVVVGASKIARDITQRVRLETANTIANAILQSTEDAVVSKSLNGIVTSWNPGAQRLFGYSAEEILGRPIQLLLPPDRQEEEASILGRIRNGETVQHFETVRRRKDGTTVPVSVTISPVRDRWGSVIGASKIARDITLQRAAQAQLRLTASVFASTAEGIVITGSDGRIVDLNPAFTRITGYAREALLGRDPQTLRSGRQDPRVFRLLRRAVLRFGEWKGELWSRRSDGESYAVMLTVSRICAANGVACNYIALISDITALKVQQEQLQYVAHFDSLTHLPNRLLLSDRLQQAIANCQRRQHMLAVLYMDIDGFKSVNDTYGHGAGDELLIALSRQMRSVMREGDTLARMGGDEFVVVLTDLESVHDCIQLVQRLLLICAQPVEVGAGMLGVTASIGVTVYPGDRVDPEQLIRHADHAMYEAKRGGKGRYHIFDAAQDAEARHLSEQQSRLAAALAGDEFVLHYQPKVNMRTGEVVGAEALIRWQHPERGLVFPGAFLPLIENHPLCELLGEWVVQNAIQQMGVWQSQGLRLPVSINISARQFQDEKFTVRLAEVLTRHPSVSPSDVELEILETSALQDVSSVQRTMRDCQALGLRFSLDDFGTGYSTLTYLKRLPVATLKIDQSFIREMLLDPGYLSIVKGVIGLAKAFDREVIAEGVETDAHGTELVALGCELGQGYAIAKPMPAGALPAWITSWKAPSAWAT